MRGGQLDGLHRGLGGGAADDDRQVVRRASGRAEALHLFGQESDERLRVQDGLGLLIQVALVRGATALRDEEEFELHPARGGDVDLRREIRARVLFGVEVERRELGVAEVVLRVGLVDAERQGLGIIAAGPDLLAFLGGDGRGAGILTERQDAFGGDLRITKHGQGDRAIVVAGFGVGQDRGDLLQMLRAEVEIDVVERLVRQEREPLGRDLEHWLAVELGDRNVVLGDQAILGRIGSQREGFLIMELRGHRLPMKRPEAQSQTETERGRRLA